VLELTVRADFGARFPDVGRERTRFGRGREIGWSASERQGLDGRRRPTVERASGTSSSAAASRRSERRATATRPSRRLDSDVQVQGEGIGVYCYLAKGCSDNLIADMVTSAINLKNEFAG
jgi:hypothetical protein